MNMARNDKAVLESLTDKNVQLVRTNPSLSAQIKEVATMVQNLCGNRKPLNKRIDFKENKDKNKWLLKWDPMGYCWPHSFRCTVNHCVMD